MSASFADAVRGGGQSLAGKPSEADDAWSGKPNPLEAVLRCPTTISPVPVLRALMSRCGPGTISCVRSVSAMNYAITCRSDADLLVLLAEPILDVEGSRCTVSRAGEPLRSVTLRGVPFDASDDDLRRLLLPFATLLDWSHESYKDFPEIANGNRRLHIKMPKPLPNFLTFRQKRVVVSYNGVQLLCFKCGSPEHAKKDCPKNNPAQTPKDPEASSVETSATSETVAAKAMPPPATPTKTSRRRKQTASPASSQSPSPLSKKRQHVQSPVVAVTTPRSSPSTRRHRTASGSAFSPSNSPSRNVSAQQQDPSADATTRMLDFHERVFKLYLEADDGGMHFRPNAEAYWIRRWCQSCWAVSDKFSIEDCKSTPACEGREVTDYGLPKCAGKHLMILHCKDGTDICCVDIGPKRWNVLPFESKALTHHEGPAVPEYEEDF